MKFTEAQLEAAIIELLGGQGFLYFPGGDIERDKSEVLIEVIYANSYLKSILKIISTVARLI